MTTKEGFLSPDARERALRARAAEVARIPTAPARVDDVELIFVSLAGVRYAVESRYVHHILPLESCTRLPAVQREVFGMLMFQGAVVLLVDLRLLLGLVGRAPTDRFRVLLVGDQEVELGLLVEEAWEVGRAVLQVAQTERTSLTKNITTDGVVVIDGAAVLADRRTFIDQADDNLATG